MSMLHTVNKSPFEKNTFDSCVSHANAGSTVLLIEDGVYAAMKGTTTEPRLNAAKSDINFYVLGPDLSARGVSEDQLIDGVKVVDYQGFVKLAAEHDNVQSWL